MSRDIVEAPLKGNGQLTVGHGNSGWAPHTFFLREGQNVDVGVVKLFLSKKQVNLSHVAQSSPFTSVPGPVGGHFTAPPSLPFVPAGGPSSTTTLPFDTSVVSRGQRASEIMRASESSDPSSTCESSDPPDWRLLSDWDTVEITVVQRRENV